MISLFSSKKPEFAIDFGTANVRVVHRSEGILFDEPSLCCFTGPFGAEQLLAAGKTVRAMLDRTPSHMRIKYSLRRGVLQDIDAATHMLRYALRSSMGRTRRAGTRVLIGVPADATQAERAALLTAASDAGIDPVRLVPEPLAAAIGAELPIQRPAGTMIVECGAGTSEVAVISLGGICRTRSVRVGGASLSRAIADDLHLRHKLLIGDLTAERVMEEYSDVKQSADRSSSIEVKGRSLLTQMPAALSLSSTELDLVAEKHFRVIIEAVRQLLSETPPELSHDILVDGIVLTGGGALSPLLKSLMSQETGLAVHIAVDTRDCVVKGLQAMLH
ncbi:rod shape-determining protein [Novosphingobium sp. ZW T3_23]|uniref:rod shape-determining protein n=1 Tax=Novosphingobium sp. ZW T3_23 TaxID=3378084 RepID=UPI0038526B12